MLGIFVQKLFFFNFFFFTEQWRKKSREGEERVTQLYSQYTFNRKLNRGEGSIQGWEEEEEREEAGKAWLRADVEGVSKRTHLEG